MLSYLNAITEYASLEGYKIIDNVILNPENKILIGNISNQGYRRFCIRTKERSSNPIYCHKLVAYQIFGEKMFEKNIMIRHLDGNKLNNNISNISIGNAHDNWMDMPKEIRHMISNKGADKQRKLLPELIENIKKDYIETKSYKYLKLKYNLSKSTIHKAIHSE